MPRLIMVAGECLVIAACSGSLPHPSQANPASHSLSSETIGWSIGPCNGFCPVYTVAVSPAGNVTFDGERHTAMLGHHIRESGPGAWHAVALALAAYRPATNTSAKTTCERQATDQSVYHITWTAPDGHVTTLTHDKGCRSARNDALTAALQSLPTALGIEPWARQMMRPRVSRG